MKLENLVIGKVYIYKDKTPVVFDKFPEKGMKGIPVYKFCYLESPERPSIYLNDESVKSFITELEIEKPEVSNFRPDHYTSLPFKLDEVQETIAENCFKATNDFKKALWVSFALKHLGRLGLKDDVNLELKKAENYLHKARTGEWLHD
jgi:hypothetical protein